MALSNVPLISSFASTAGWAAAIGSRVAAAFGYSHPINTHMTNRMNRTVMPNYHNFDAVD